MRTMRGRIGLTLAVALVAGWSEVGLAEEPVRRELAGHVFFPSLVVTNPFVQTYAELSVGGGYAWIDGFGFDLQGNPVGEDSYEAAVLSEGIALQAGLTPWLALRAEGAGGLTSGINGRSALVVGINPPIVVGAGVTASWQLGRIVRLGGTLDFTYTRIWLIRPLEALRSSLLISRVDTASVAEDVEGYSILPGVTAAVAPHPALGLLASAQYRWRGYRRDSDRNLSFLILGASAQLDLRRVPGPAPLGFLVSYGAEIPLQSDSRSVQILEGGVFYTGRVELDLGVDVQLRWFDLRPDTRRPLDTVALVGLILIRYNWN